MYEKVSQSLLPEVKVHVIVSINIAYPPPSTIKNTIQNQYKRIFISIITTSPHTCTCIHAMYMYWRPFRIFRYMYMHTYNVHVLETIQNLPFIMVQMIHVYVIVIAQLPVIYELNWRYLTSLHCFSFAGPG